VTPTRPQRPLRNWVRPLHHDECRVRGRVVRSGRHLPAHFVARRIRAACAGRGQRNALVELPLAGNLADAQRVVQAAKRSDKQVFVDMFERFIPANQALVDAVRASTYGRLEQLTLWNLTAHRGPVPRWD
jgi:predicted dehydrogenase